MHDNDENFIDSFDRTGESEDLGKTQEMDSVRFEHGGSGEERSITPRDEFTDLNSADDMSRTRLMDSLAEGEPREEHSYTENPVKRRRRRKKNQINHTRTMGQIFLGAVISVVAICLGFVLAFNVIDALRDITGMAKQQAECDIVIEENTTVEDVANTLNQNKIILSPKLFVTYVNSMKDKFSGLYIGPHTISSNMSYGSLVANLQTEKKYTKTVSVLIPEGSTAADIGRILEENYVCRAVDFEKFYKKKQNEFDFEEGIADNDNRFNMLEGYLFPDTYEFFVVEDMKTIPTMNTESYAKEAAYKMYNNFQDKIDEELTERMEELGMTLDETIILASLIQREGTNEDNMSKVSSVFHNRMNDAENFPQLQSDTTDTYIEQCLKPKITASNQAKMQAVIDAYDTYNCEGLPAGAICNPGLEAINAALYPAQTDYKYFLADKDGIFWYAQTLEQHEANIRDAALHENAGG